MSAPQNVEKHVIPSQCSHWRGNPLEFQTFLLDNSRFLPLLEGIATPVCGLVRNDIEFFYFFDSLRGAQ